MTSVSPTLTRAPRRLKSFFHWLEGFDDAVATSLESRMMLIKPIERALVYRRRTFVA
jgi:hypothetical protein